MAMQMIIFGRPMFRSAYVNLEVGLRTLASVRIQKRIYDKI